MEGNEEEKDDFRVLIKKVTIKTPNKTINKVEVIDEDYISE